MSIAICKNRMVTLTPDVSASFSLNGGYHAALVDRWYRLRHWCRHLCLAEQCAGDSSLRFLALRQLAGGGAVGGARRGCADRRAGIDPECDQGTVGPRATAAPGRDPGGRQGLPRTPRTRTRICDGTECLRTC